VLCAVQGDNDKKFRPSNNRMASVLVKYSALLA